MTDNTCDYYRGCLITRYSSGQVEYSSLSSRGPWHVTVQFRSNCGQVRQSKSL